MKLFQLAIASTVLAGTAFGQISLTPVSSVSTGPAADIFDGSAAEIVQYDAQTQRVFVVNAMNDAIDVYDISDIENPLKLPAIDVSPYGSPNSVAINPRPGRNEIAVAVENSVKTDNGSVVFFDKDGQFLAQVTAGALPDMLTYDKTGRLLVVANEGEPNDDYSIDPEGSVTIIEVNKGPAAAVATQISLSPLNGTSPEGVRITGPAGTTVAQDLEPEYIAISPDGKSAYVACQENNAVIVIDLHKKVLSGIFGLGYKDHLLPGNGLDASNKDDGINIRNWPVRGLYMPDSMVAYKASGQTFLITANEGDSRDYDGYKDEARVKDTGEDGIPSLDPDVFPDSSITDDENLGRIKFVMTEGNLDGDPEYEAIYTFGTRSFSIWTTDGTQVYDSGDAFEQITAALLGEGFNSTNDESPSFDNRSDDKGPEPEGLALGSIEGRTYVFIGLERVGGVMVYDVTDPYAPAYVTYVNNRDFAVAFEEDDLSAVADAGDLGPEGLAFVPAGKSPNGKPLLIVGNEVSGTTTLFEIAVD